MKQGCEGVSPLHPACQLPYSRPSRSHPGQPFLLICPSVVKAPNSSQIYRQHDVLYFKNTLSPSTKGILEQAHQKTRIQTQVFSPFGFLSPRCMIPRGPLTDAFISTPKAVLLACSLPLQLRMSGEQSYLKNYHSCLFSPLFSSQRKILLQLPLAELLGMRNHPERLGGAAALVLVSQSGCVSYSQPRRVTSQWCHGFAYLSSPKRRWLALTRRGVPNSGVSHEIHFRADGITKLTGL